MLLPPSDLPKPNVPRLNPDRPGLEGGAETAHSAVTTLPPFSLRGPTRSGSDNQCRDSE